MTIRPSQKVAGVSAMVISFIILVLGWFWGDHDNNQHSGFLGGFNKCTIHACVMITGMCFSYTQAVTCFRVFGDYFGHDIAKRLHIMWHSIVIGSIITGLCYIINFHNDEDWGHLSSMHSWLGLILIFVYIQNYFLGILYFGIQNFMPELAKKGYLPTHRFLGIVGFLLAPIVLETGIAQKHWIDGTFGCIYAASVAQKNNPALGYNEIGAGCRFSLGIGFLVILNSFLGIYALWDFPAVVMYSVVSATESGTIIEVGTGAKPLETMVNT